MSFINSLTNYNLFDASTIIHETQIDTFHRNNSSSRIDYIWLTPELMLNTFEANVSPVNFSLSDHCIVYAKYSNFLQIKSNDYKCLSKSSFNLNKMDAKKWTQFRDKLDSAVNGCVLKSLSTSTIWSQSTLNKYWDLFQDTVVSTANKTIPVSKSTVRRLSKQPIALSNLYENIRTLQKFSIHLQMP